MNGDRSGCAAVAAQLAEYGSALVRCQGCGEFTAVDPHDLRGSLGEDVPRCAACRGLKAFSRRGDLGSSL
jgi:hypothetical protein